MVGNLLLQCLNMRLQRFDFVRHFPRTFGYCSGGNVRSAVRQETVRNADSYASLIVGGRSPFVALVFHLCAVWRNAKTFAKLPVCEPDLFRHTGPVFGLVR